MKVPCRWLADYVKIEVTKEAVDRLAERLTLAGLEVEGIDATGTLRGATVGYVETCDPLPNSDHLSLCHVNLGDQTVEIVCGAPNVAAGMTVPVVTPGGELPGGFTIDPDGTPLSVANNGSDVACLAFTDPGKALANAIGIH